MSEMSFQSHFFKEGDVIWCIKPHIDKIKNLRWITQKDCEILMEATKRPALIWRKSCFSKYYNVFTLTSDKKDKKRDPRGFFLFPKRLKEDTVSWLQIDTLICMHEDLTRGLHRTQINRLQYDYIIKAVTLARLGKSEHIPPETYSD